MKTVWKGLVVGGIVGAGAGAILDARHRSEVGAAGADGKVPEAVGRVRDTLAAAATETASRVRGSEVPDQVRDAIGATRRRLGAAQERIRASSDGA